MSYLDLGGFDAAEIGELMRLLARTDVEECEIQRGDTAVSLKRTVSASRPPAQLELPESPAADSHAVEGPHLVVSPAVGVFYRVAERGEDTSVQDGTQVAAGEILGVVEVLGVPHPVKSTANGLVDHFLVEDGEAVEYGQPIVAISES
jgi:acetyl-CoA carboxylase biotin carboxyl carrier protein